MSLGIVTDGTLEGLLTVVYQHYYEKLNPDDIVSGDIYQPKIGFEYREINTNMDQAAKVFPAIEKKISKAALSHVFSAFLSNDPDRFHSIYHYILLGFSYGYAVDRYEQNGYVLHVHNLSKNVSRESHFFKEFMRFATTKTGVLYGKFEPVNQVLPLVAEHFSDRLLNEQWIIHDIRHHQAAIYDGKEVCISHVPENATVDVTEDQAYYQALFKSFFEAIAVEGRVNKKLQRSMLPLRYRRYMPEFYPSFPEK